MANPVARREHVGAATPATLTADMSNVGLTASLSTNTGWPTGAVGTFFVVIDPGTSSEEKVLCTSQSGSALTISSRGQDGTIAKAHLTGAVAYPCWTAAEADELNAHAAATTGVHGAAGAVVGTTDAQVLTNKTISGASNTLTNLPGITALTGDVTAAGPGSAAGTLATVNANVGSFGSASSVATQTVNAKGLTTAAATVPIIITESAVTNLVTDLAAKQPLDADLTALAALDAVGGFMVQTAVATFAKRGVTSSGATIGITNPNGTFGNLNLDLVDTGWIATGFANQGVWVASLFRYRIFGGKFCFLEVDSAPASGTLTASSTGNLTNTNVISIPAAARPFASGYAMFNAPNSSGCFQYQSGGLITILDAHPTSVIATGDSCRFRACYVIVA